MTSPNVLPTFPSDCHWQAGTRSAHGACVPPTRRHSCTETHPPPPPTSILASAYVSSYLKIVLANFRLKNIFILHALYSLWTQWQCRKLINILLLREINQSPKNNDHTSSQQSSAMQKCDFQLSVCNEKWIIKVNVIQFTHTAIKKVKVPGCVDHWTHRSDRIVSKTKHLGNRSQPLPKTDLVANPSQGYDVKVWSEALEQLQAKGIHRFLYCFPSFVKSVRLFGYF